LYTPSKLIELDEEKKREKEQLQAEKLLKKQEAERKKKEKADARETKKKEKEMKLNQQENEKKSKEQSKILKEQQKALKNLDLHDIYDQENRPPRPVNIVVTRQKASSINYSKLNDSGF
jgi:seryl-tRNA synthetase